MIDRHWNVLTTNDAAPRFFDMAAARTGPRNMLHLIFDPQRMRPFVADWDTVSRSLLQRVHRRGSTSCCVAAIVSLTYSMPRLAAIRHIATVSPPEWCERPTTREWPLQFETCRSPHIVPKGRNGRVECGRLALPFSR